MVLQPFAKAEAAKPVSVTSKKAVLVAADDSEPSQRALVWALENFAGEDVMVGLFVCELIPPQLHVVSVVQPKVDAMMPQNVQEKELAEFMTKEETKVCNARCFLSEIR